MQDFKSGGARKSMERCWQGWIHGAGGALRPRARPSAVLGVVQEGVALSCCGGSGITPKKF
jgi:hypothetical protein